MEPFDSSSSQLLDSSTSQLLDALTFADHGQLTTDSGRDSHASRSPSAGESGFSRRHG
jgi:hypothetical protein